MAPEVVAFGGVAAILTGAVLSRWPWARQRRRFVAVALATGIGCVAWNLTLVATNATGFLVDAPVVPLSLQDVGSGVAAFAATAAGLGLLLDPDEPARAVVGTAGIAGLVAMIFDIFVL